MHNNKVILLARGTSEVGNAIRQVILALSILQIRQNPQDLYNAEVLETCGVLCMMLLGPFFIDRVCRKKSLVLADFLCVANSIFLFFAASANSLPGLLIGSFFTTLFSSFYSSNLNAYISDAAGKKLNVIRHGLNRIQLSILLGSLVGLLGTTVSIPVIELKYFFLVDALSFLISTVLILKGARATPKQRRKLGSPLSDWILGLKHSLSSYRLRLVVTSALFGGISYGIFESSSVVHIVNVVKLSESWVTMSRALNRVGAILVLVIMFDIQKRFYHNKNLLWVLIGGSLTVFSYGLMSTTSAFLFLSGSVILVAGMSIINPSLSAVVGASTESSFSGRVFSFYSLAAFVGVLIGNFFVAIFGIELGTSSCLQLAGVIYSARLILGAVASKAPTSS